MAADAIRGLFARKVDAVLKDELGQLKARIAQNIMTAGANASGKTINSMQVFVGPDVNNTVGELTGRKYFGALETGARPWSVKPKRVPTKFAEIIEQWMEDKGISGDMSPYAVAYKIIHEGTELFRAGGRDTIYSKEIPKTIKAVRTRLLGQYSEMVTSNIQLNQDGKN